MGLRRVDEEQANDLDTLKEEFEDILAILSEANAAIIQELATQEKE